MQNLININRYNSNNSFQIGIKKSLLHNIFLNNLSSFFFFKFVYKNQNFSWQYLELMKKNYIWYGQLLEKKWTHKSIGKLSIWSCYAKLSIAYAYSISPTIFLKSSYRIGQCHRKQSHQNTHRVFHFVETYFTIWRFPTQGFLIYSWNSLRV